MKYINKTLTSKSRSFLICVYLIVVLSFINMNLLGNVKTKKLTSKSPTHTFWVSPSGSDSASGTRSKPFRTIKKAQQVVRSYIPAMRQNIIVNIDSGMYRLTKPLSFTPEDGGKNGYKVIYQATSENSSPVICGSIPVKGWELHDSKKNIWKAKVPNGMATRQLYVNGKRAFRAQTEPILKAPVGFRPSYADYGPSDSTGGIEFYSSIFNPADWRNVYSWKNINKIEAVYDGQWKMMSVPLKAIALDSVQSKIDTSLTVGLLTLQDTGWTNANVFRNQVIDTVRYDTSYVPGIWSFWQVSRFENAYQFLDKPGEWYLDDSIDSLYYIPRQGEKIDTSHVELPVLEVLIHGQGKPDRPLQNISFEGLTFAYATWNAPSTGQGYVADQSGFHLTGTNNEINIIGHVKSPTRTPGNIRFNYAHNINFKGNTFKHLGAVAVDLEKGCVNDSLSYNHFEDISSAAIQVGGVLKKDAHPNSSSSRCSHNTITDNTILKTGRDYTDAAAIMIGFTDHTTISHNDISDVPWSGIAMGWGWGLYDPTYLNGDTTTFPGVPGGKSGQWGKFTNPTVNSYNRITNNRISKFVMKRWDGGAIYTTGSQGQSGDSLIISGNVAFDKNPSGGSNIFYTDGGSRYVVLRNNASYNNPRGNVYFGPILPYSNLINPLEDEKTSLLFLANFFPYGSEIGGCVTCGDIVYENNYWENHWQNGFFDQLYFKLLNINTKISAWPKNPLYYDPCRSGSFDTRYPVNLLFKKNKIITNMSEVPEHILENAGVRQKVRYNNNK